MTISDTCKFEFKANVDRVVREDRCARRVAIAKLAAEIGLLEETARKKDQRARKELGQIVPKTELTETTEQNPNLKKLEKPSVPTHGGSRQNSGRKPKPVIEIVSEDFQTAFDQMLRAVKNAKALGWRDTDQASAVRLINVLYDVATIS